MNDTISKSTKNSDFLKSLIRKKNKSSININEEKSITNVNIENKIDKRVFNQDMFLYAKSQQNKQK